MHDIAVRLHALAWPAPLEIVAAVLILINIWLAVKENIWCWPVGIAGVVLYALVNFQAKFYSNAVLQLFFLVLSIHGWYEWLHGGVNRSELHVSKTTRRQWIGCMAAGVVLTGAILLFLRLTTDAALPFWDASTTAFSLVAQWMMNEKLVENWLLWVVIDVIYVPFYVVQGLWLTGVVVYAISVWLAWRGYVDWRKTWRRARELAA